MALTDEEFREEYKPLLVPPHYDKEDTQQNKVIFALAEIGEGTADDVLKELEKLEPGIADDQMVAFTKSVLADLYNKGKLAGNEHNGIISYNLHKITSENSGSTHPGPKA